MDKNYQQEYYHLERNHWWFRARENILKSYLDSALKNFQTPLKILNIGASTGKSSQMLEKFGVVDSVENDETTCRFLQNELNIKAFNYSAKALPFEKDSYDLICGFDVIEHIDDDEAVIKEIKRVLKPGGAVLLTVPAYMFLWSHHDVVNQHYRRYTKYGLRLITGKQFREIYCSYFNCFLFPAIWGSRLFSRLFPNKVKRRKGSGSDFSIYNKNFFDKVFFHVFNYERYLIERKFRLPFGVSLIYHGTIKTND